MPIYFLGMLIGKYYHKIKFNKFTSILFCLVFAVATVFWHIFMYNDKLALDKKIKYFGDFNPPGISFFVYSLLILGFGICCDAVIREYKMKVPIFIEEKLSTLGRYSYYIFLFHKLIISVLQTCGLEVLVTGNIWFRRFTYLIVTFGVSILIGFFMEKLMKYILKTKEQKMFKEVHNE